MLGRYFHGLGTPFANIKAVRFLWPSATPLRAILFYLHARGATRIDAMNYGPGQIKLTLMG